MHCRSYLAAPAGPLVSPHSTGESNLNDIAEALRSALALIGSGDPVLLRIVALSLGVSLSAVACATLLGLPLGAAIAVARFPGRQVADRGAQRPDGPAAGRGRPGRLSAAVARRAAGRARAAVHAAGDGHRADRADPADHRRAGAPGGRGRVARVRGAAALARRARFAAGARRCSGTSASRWSPPCSPASGAPAPKSAR